MCPSVCLSAGVCPHYCTDPDVTWGSGRGCPIVLHYWAALQSVHGFRCNGNMNVKCQRVLVVALWLAFAYCVHISRQRMTATISMSSWSNYYQSTNSGPSITSVYADVSIPKLIMNTSTRDNRVQQASGCEIRHLWDKLEWWYIILIAFNLVEPCVECRLTGRWSCRLLTVLSVVWSTYTHCSRQLYTAT